VLKAPPVKSTLAERILAESDALLMVRLDPNVCNRALLMLLYGAGWHLPGHGSALRDLAERDGAGQVHDLGTDVHAPEQVGE
jgi:hypothetical protein